MLRISLLLASARALQAPPRAHRATHLRAAEAALAVDAADAFDQFGVAAVAASHTDARQRWPHIWVIARAQVHSHTGSLLKPGPRVKSKRVLACTHVVQLYLCLW